MEDGLTDRAIISTYLQQAGSYVFCVRSVEEAQQRLQEWNPDLIVLDVILPGVSGYELCRDLKSDPHTSRIPVIFCSTKNTRVDKMWGGMLGADAYLSKPIEREELLRTVQQLIKN